MRQTKSAVFSTNLVEPGSMGRYYPVGNLPHYCGEGFDKASGKWVTTVFVRERSQSGRIMTKIVKPIPVISKKGRIS